MYRLIEKFATDIDVLPHALLLIIGAVLLVVGCYTVGPWYIGGPTTSIGSVLESDIVRAVPSVFYIISGGMAVAGVYLKKKMWRYNASFLCTLSYAFLLGLRLFAFGFVPIIWVFILALGLISAIIFLWESGREVE
jgi:hypothetical protein